MAILLDTNALDCWATGDTRLSATAAAAIEKADRIELSIVSFWELAIKVAVGKMRVDVLDLAEKASPGAMLLPVTPAHCQRYAWLPLHHRDPFDRMIVAQALHEGLTLATGDRRLVAYTDDLVLCG